MAAEKLRGKFAIVTGAGGGIGRAIALAFARAGAGVQCADIDSAAAKVVADEIRNIGGNATFREVDVSDMALLAAQSPPPWQNSVPFIFW
jgi:3-oxoacyl-[acyl-carrier protein] reductase